jgi:hypothetical protein
VSRGGVGYLCATWSGADESGVELDEEAQIWPLLRRLGDLARDGQLGSGNEVMRGIVPVAAVGQQDLLAALRDNA